MTLRELIGRGDLAGLKAALASGADANELGEPGRTPLMDAAETGRVDLVDALLGAGADPSLTDALDETPLLKAAARGHAQVYARLLRYAGADERAFAATLLRSSGTALPPGPPPDPSEAEGTPWPDRFARAGAAVSDALGDSDPKRRLERILRSRKGGK